MDDRQAISLAADFANKNNLTVTAHVAHHTLYMDIRAPYRIEIALTVFVKDLCERALAKAFYKQAMMADPSYWISDCLENFDDLPLITFAGVVQNIYADRANLLIKAVKAMRNAGLQASIPDDLPLVVTTLTTRDVQKQDQAGALDDLLDAVGKYTEK